jgi:hypothetical protein
LPEAQSLLLVHAPVLQPVPVARQAIDPAQAVAAPAVQVWLLLQVLLVIIEVVKLHDGVPQSDPTAG